MEPRALAYGCLALAFYESLEPRALACKPCVRLLIRAVHGRFGRRPDRSLNLSHRRLDGRLLVTEQLLIRRIRCGLCGLGSLLELHHLARSRRLGRCFGRRKCAVPLDERKLASRCLNLLEGASVRRRGLLLKIMRLRSRRVERCGEDCLDLLGTALAHALGRGFRLVACLLHGGGHRLLLRVLGRRCLEHEARFKLRHPSTPLGGQLNGGLQLGAARLH